MIKKFDEFIKESIIVPPNIPNTMHFWHGGNLNNFDDVISQKNGRYEFGAGLYITTHYGTAQKYSKGSRKLYLITVEKGNDINDCRISLNEILKFVNVYSIKSKRKEILSRIEKYTNEEGVKANVFNNVILNEKAIKSTDTRFLRQFYVDNGIDYEIVNNAFGWGEQMMILYNMKKIKNVIVVGTKDEIEEYDLSKFNK